MTRRRSFVCSAVPLAVCRRGTATRSVQLCPAGLCAGHDLLHDDVQVRHRVRVMPEAGETSWKSAKRGDTASENAEVRACLDVATIRMVIGDHLGKHRFEVGRGLCAGPEA
jgi:hypothetical protein